LKKKHAAIGAVIVVSIIVLLWFFGGGASDAPDYTVFSANEKGVSLLYDILRELRYPVKLSYSPFDPHSGYSDVYIFIEPENINDETAEKLLIWVRRGGRIIFMDSQIPNQLQKIMNTSEAEQFGGLSYYSVGSGAVLSGSSAELTNKNLMENSRPGQVVEYILHQWQPKNIYFMEYYHGYTPSDNMFGGLPEGYQLIICQIAVFFAALVWLYGKRFGKPEPYLEADEREENENVKALSRLYYNTRRKQ